MLPQNGRIPESFIQEVLSNTDIVALIKESVSLKKSGANYSACCPFHQEKTPSFTVSQSKQFYHCFGCKKHGDAIGFLMENQSLTFVEAIEVLASRLGLSVPQNPKEKEKLQIKGNTTSVLNQVAHFYSDMLKNHPQSTHAITYLKKRGLTGIIAKKFALGFAPPGWDNLLLHFQHDVHALKVLEETGLLVKHPQGRLYDRFRNRIMFPIRDKKGEVIGFGGRVMGQDQPKYLNSPESAIFQKGHCLYGVYEMFQAKTRLNKTIVVEGYFDVVSLAQYNMAGAVATLGTAITPHHLLQIFQWEQEIIFCFDGDNAGKAAAWKALQLVLPVLKEGRQVRFAFLPPGEDPDTYIRKVGYPSFEDFILNSMPLSDYFFSSLLENGNSHSVDSRAHLANLARPMLEQIPAGIFKEMMFEQLALMLQSSAEIVRGKKAVRHSFAPQKKYYKNNPPLFVKEKAPPQPFSPAQIAAIILLRSPALLETVLHVNALKHDIDMIGFSLLKEVVELLKDTPSLTTSALHQILQQKGRLTASLLDCDKKVQLTPVEGLKAELEGALVRIEAIGQRQLAEKWLKKAREGELNWEEKQKLKEILQLSGIN